MYEEWSALKKLICIYIVKLKNKIKKLLVRGISPLFLGNAAAGEIVSLIQYGKCEQDGTPTSVAPVDIKCNNGALKMLNLANMIDGNIVVGKYINNSGVEASALSNFYYSPFIPVKASTAYTLKTSRSLNYSSFMEYDANNDFLERTLYGSADTPAGDTVTLTTRNDTAYIRFGSNINGQALTAESVLGIDWMLAEGSAGQSYVPYGQLTIVGTSEVLTVSGANLLNPQTVPDENQFVNKNTGGLTAPSASGGVWRYTDYIPVIGGETYYFHQINATATTAGTAWYDSEKTYIGGINATALGSANNKVTIPSSAAYLRHSWRIDEGYNTDWENTVYICIDGALTEFQSYVTPQTASTVNLLAVGNIKDEQNLISGVVTRKCAACLYDGTQPVGDTYLSTTGGKDNGAIIVYPLAESTTEQATPQSLSTAQGTNIISVTAEVVDIELEAIYKGK